MTKRPLSESRHADVRGIDAALRRAALRARDMARMTHTRLVLSHDGKIEYVAPDDHDVAASSVTQPTHE